MAQTNIEVRCKVCHSLAFRVSSRTQGELEFKCKKCKALRVVTLPLRAQVAAPLQTA